MLGSVLLLCLCILFLLFQLKPRRPKNFPSGPPTLPLVGNLFNLSQENPLKDLERLRNAYGNVYSLFLGRRPAVVLNGLKAMKEAIVTKGADFAGRPQDMFVNDVTQNRGVILADYGLRWREHRRFALMTLRNFGLGKTSMEDRIHDEIQFTIKTLEQSTAGGTLSPQVMFHNAASNIICQVLFGKRYEYNDELIKIIVQCFTENAKIANGPWAMLYDSLPITRYLPLPFRNGFRNYKTCQNIAMELVKEHKKTKVPGEPRDFLDCYLDELDKRKDDGSSFSEELLINYILDLHFAGTDTTSNTLLTGFLYLMNYPHIQERCQQEIDQVLQGKDRASFEDRLSMPYVQAVIHEIQRIANTVPLSVFHCTTKDTELMGYTIPKRPKNFPPGPPILPVLGNLLNLSLENPLKDFDRLSKSYGNIYSIYIGPRPSVILNGLKAMKEAMVIKGVDFSGRPQDLFVNDVSCRNGGVGVILADYGPSWREHRRFALMTLRNFGLGKKSMEDRIHDEIQHTIKTLEGSIGKTLSPRVMFHNAASNIICQVLFGKRYEYDDDMIKTIVKCFTENAKIANGPWAMIYDSIPFCRNFPLPFRKAFKNAEICQNYINCLVTEYKKTRVPGDPRHFVDCYLDELEKRNDDGSSFSEAQLMIYSLDLHFAGTDTTSNTLLTGFLYLMAYPHVQERCQQEIDQVLEGKDRVCFEDRNSMPYVQAVLHEIQRIANTVPLSVFHCTTKDTELLGYSIPKGTMIIQNLNSVLREEGQWKFPHEFNPENFLNEKGEFVKPEAFMPFSAGPRMCLGEGLARMELFLITVTLLRKFNFIWPEDAGEPDFTPVYGVTLTPKPYHMKVQLRSKQ
uniref:Cytochrome P450 n=1 Tax=Poecilia mexicana TaxID=48701 RepID=A0A3B3XJQ9_9TELE